MSFKRLSWLPAILLAACVAAPETADRPAAPTVAALLDPPAAASTGLPPATRALEMPAVTATTAINRRVPFDDPVHFSFSIPFDGIPPVYDPRFVPAAGAPLQAGELVMGVAWNGEAKAYPVSVLRFREMVNDELAGIPILVSW